MIAFVSWDTGLDPSSPKIEPYRFSIMGCISQNFPRFVSRSSSAALDSYAVNRLFKSLAIMLIAWTYHQADR
jgi:hypothetical protein